MRERAAGDTADDCRPSSGWLAAMAIVYKATVRPSKQAIVTDWLDQQPWGGSGAVEVLGSYRFDDPDGRWGSRRSWSIGAASSCTSH